MNLEMDPLDDSDEEPLDHNTRLDYSQFLHFTSVGQSNDTLTARRLNVLSRILSSPTGPASPI